MTTATLYNQSGHHTPAIPKSNLPPEVKKIVVVGGGSAGWMTALLLGDALVASGIQVQVLESDSVAAIGVGEGSTPWMRGYFEQLGIAEAEWMPACNATYKCGIRFDGWSTRPGFESYFHPFASMLDNLTMTPFTHNVQARINGADVAAHPDRFFIATELARQHLAPKADHRFPFDVWYAYHFDAALLGQFLQRKAIERGVQRTVGHVEGVQLNERGDIASVRTRDGQEVTGDFFIDCSGFAGLLIQQALGTPWVPYGGNLYNDRAVALPTPIGTALPSQTVSTAMRHGWKWQIPLTNRFGNGYVYSSAFCTADEAERELRQDLGLLESEVPARHLEMRVGRVTQHWNRNCVAVGLSQGFIEPLEATALLFVQRTATAFLEAFEEGDLSEAVRNRFNDRINEHFEGTRDYIVTHYKTNSRSDTDYWRANAANTDLSDPLQALLAQWQSGRSIGAGIDQQRFGRGYPVFSWYCLLGGMGLFPGAGDLRAPTPQEARFSMAEVGNLLQRSALNFRPHREVLAAIPPQRQEASLQLYFW
ncbi:MAG: tryptophan 7-halogenase [Pseudomonadota bacterium]|nr:tryptophan 7-halogenase [Pseudomonadota bacterium]